MRLAGGAAIRYQAIVMRVASPIWKAGRRAIWAGQDRTLREARLRDALRSARDPVLGVDVISGGLASSRVVEQNGSVVAEVDVDVGSAGHPARDAVAEACASAAASVSGLDEVRVRLRATGFGAALSRSQHSLRSVRCAIGIASCKGGVGKSTVAWQLARAFWRRGGRVGLVDADVHGPSLPSLLGKPEARQLPSPAGGGLALPVHAEATGVFRLASVGFISEPTSEPAALRGPLAGRVATQLVHMTDWGELDYLLVDLPPGIGDVPLAVLRDVPLDGVIVVTTPSRLAGADVERGLGLIDQFRVPTIALAENMAFLDCPSCGDRHRVFGNHETRTRLAARLGLQENACFQLPFSLHVRDANEGGTTSSHHDEIIDNTFASLAEHIATYLLRAHYADRDRTFDATFDPARQAIVLRCFLGDAATEHHLPISALRAPVRDPTPTRQKRSASTETPTRLFLLGKRALSIDWSSGKKNDVYPLELLLELAKGQQQPPSQAPG